MLYLVATPIGNLSDISERVVETLREVDFIASEDTRKTGVLLKKYDLKKPQIPFYQFNEKSAGRKIIALLLKGKSVALVTNGGTPGISDPGFTLVRSAIERDIKITMIPGPSAFVVALVLSGLPVFSFVFRGFAPKSAIKRRRFFERDKDLSYTLIYYESPYRLRSFLADALVVFGDRRAAVAKELTKVFESVMRGCLSELLLQLPERPKGEYVVVIAGADRGSSKGL